MFGVIAAFVTYFLVIFCIAYVAYVNSPRKEDADVSGFMLGDRSLNFWVTALSAHASDMSSWVFMGYPALIYSFGLYGCWVAIGLLLFMFLNWHFVAPAIRSETERLNCYTLSSYFEKRFSDDSGILRLLSALMYLVFFTIYISSLIYSIGLIVETSFGINFTLGAVLGVCVMVAYTFIGGFVAVSWVDFFQAIFLLFMIIVVPLIAYFQVGGLAAIRWHAQLKLVPLTLLPDYHMSTISRAVLMMFGWGLGYFGMPHVITKFMGIDKPREMYKSKYVGIAWQFIIMIAATSVGLVGIAFFNLGIDNKELIFIEMTRKLFPPFLSGLTLCGILAATISTIDSMLIVSASVIAEDIYKKSFSRKVSRESLIAVFRLSIVAVASASLIIAIARLSTIYNLVWYAWTGLGCSFGPVLLSALYSNKVNKHGAIAGILTGGVVSAIWQPWLSIALGYSQVPGMIPGFFLSLLMIFLVSDVSAEPC